MAKKLNFSLLLGSVIAATLTQSVSAQQQDLIKNLRFPARSVRIIVPIAPGGGNDILARAIGQQLQTLWQQSVIIDNRAGGGGTIGTEIASKAAPDGHTLLMANISHSVNQALHSKLPYDATRDFTAVAYIASSPNILIVSRANSATSVKDILNIAKSQPGSLTYASAGNASSPHLAMELFKFMTGTVITHVPYKGTGPAITALLGQEVALSFSTLPPALQHIKANRLRGLAISTSKRSSLLPEVPTIEEAGVKNYNFSAWFGLVAPAKTNSALIQKINTDIASIVSQSDTAEKFSGLGMELATMSPALFQEHILNETVRWAKVANAAKIAID